MDADFSIELGREDPILDFPWTDPDGKLAYFDLKRQPETLGRVKEATQFPELAEFLRAINSAISAVESAKCDVWATEELSAEEAIFGASHKFASYVDLVFSRADHHESFPFHERFAKRLVELLWQTPETPSAAEVCVRRGYYAEKEETREGFYFTVYVNGYGDDEARARQNWEIGLKLVAHATLQLSAVGAETPAP
jgi:hypothetical protein